MRGSDLPAHATSIKMQNISISDRIILEVSKALIFSLNSREFIELFPSCFKACNYVSGASFSGPCASASAGPKLFSVFVGPWKHLYLSLLKQS